MTKVHTIFLAVLFFYCLFGGIQSQVFAADNVDCEDVGVSGILIDPIEFEEGTVDEVYVQFNSSNIAAEGYKVKVFDNSVCFGWACMSYVAEETIPASGWKQNTGDVLTFNFVSDKAVTADDWGSASSDEHSIYLYKESNTNVDAWCRLGKYTINRAGYSCTENIRMSQERTAIVNGVEEPATCYINDSTSCVQKDTPTLFSVKGAKGTGGNFVERIYVAYTGAANYYYEDYAWKKGSFEWEDSFSIGDKSVYIKSSEFGPKFDGFNCGGFDFQVKEVCPAEQCETTNTSTGPGATTVGKDSFSLCKQISEDQVDARGLSLRDQCLECTGGSLEDEKDGGVWTAIGCIQRDPTSIIERLIRVGLGLSGGVALITFLAAGFIFSTSQGDPKEYGKAKEMMTASIVGLIFIIFSITILQFIGYSILKIPGFGG